MKAVILAAGAGRRLAAMGWNKPKCLLGFGDTTLLDHTLSALLARRIDRVTIVLGYQPELVRHVCARHPGMRFDEVINDDFAQTNTINSLYLARQRLDEDFLYFNADVLYDPRVLDLLLASEGSRFAIDVKPCGAEEVKVITAPDGRITRIGKELPVEQCLGEFIGVGRFAKSACQAMVASLVRYNEQLGQRRLFFEAAVDDILKEHPFKAVRMDGLAAVEIDTPEDYQRACQLWQKRTW